MRIVALLAVRNEELFLERCIRHLVAQGVETCVIDNQSTDRSRQIAEDYLHKGVCQIVDHPFPGHFDFIGILKAKEQLATTIEADWFIHHDADEIRQAPVPGQTLRDAIRSVDAEGYTAINFDEFVFVPTSHDERFEHTDYYQTMTAYYHFAPRELHRLNAWKKPDTQIKLVRAGHGVEFDGLQIFPEPFILRHYIFLSAAHGEAKYGARKFAPAALARGWHHNRQGIPITTLIGKPSSPYIRRLGTWDSIEFDRSAPATAHCWEW